MKKSTFSLLLFSSLSIFFLSNCASLTGFQTGRTVGQENGEFMASLNVSQSPDFDLDLDNNDTTGIENLFFPNIEISGRYGIAEKVDLGLRLNTNLNAALDVKYQFVGDQESEVAVSAGAGIGTFGLVSALWNVQIPLYFSFHPNDKLDIYISPRYIAQFAAGDISGNINYLGGNAGVLFGSKVKFGIDAGIYNVNAVNDLSTTAISTIGIGIKVPFN